MLLSTPNKWVKDGEALIKDLKTTLNWIDSGKGGEWEGGARESIIQPW